MDFLQIILGIFSVFGIYCYIRNTIDDFVMKKANCKCKVLICNCDDDIEYAVRFAESRFIENDFGAFFDGICIDKSIDIPEETLEKLNNEFENNIMIT